VIAPLTLAIRRPAVDEEQREIGEISNRVIVGLTLSALRL
jgi:hypothetical protein